MNDLKDQSKSTIIYQIRFDRTVDLKGVEDTMLLAILAVACLHGDSAVQLDARYAINTSDNSVIVDASTAIGRYILKVFTGLCARQFGESGFRVVRPSAGRRPMPKAPVTRPVPPSRPHPRKRHALVSGAD